MFAGVDPDRCEQMFYRMVFPSRRLPFKEKNLSLSDLALKIKIKNTWENKKPSIFATKLAIQRRLRWRHLSDWLTALFPPPISNDLSHNVSVFDKRTLLVLHSLKDVH